MLIGKIVKALSVLASGGTQTMTDYNLARQMVDDIDFDCLAEDFMDVCDAAQEEFINLGYIARLNRHQNKAKLNIYHLNEKKRGIVYARNKCLLSAKEFNPDYLAFIDDDVRLDNNWLQNNLLIMNKFKADIVTFDAK